MFSAAIRSLSQVFQPEYRPFFWRAIGYTLGLLLVFWIIIQGIIGYYVNLPYPWLETVLTFLTGFGAIIGLGYLLAPVSAMVVALFQDDIALKVESADYPNETPGTPLPIGKSMLLAAKFAGVVLLANIVALFLLLVPGINLVAFFLINGYLLGREFFEFAAMRFLPPEEARLLRKANGGYVFTAGIIIAILLSIPILNLITPIFATIFMVHLFKVVKIKTYS